MNTFQPIRIVNATVLWYKYVYDSSIHSTCGNLCLSLFISCFLHLTSIPIPWHRAGILKKRLQWVTALYLCCLRGKGHGMTPAKIEINETNQAVVSSRRGHINLPRLLKINDAKGKHLDNELYNDGWWAEFLEEKPKIFFLFVFFCLGGFDPWQKC